MKKIIVTAAVLVMASAGSSQASQVFFSTDKQASAVQTEYQKASCEQDKRFFNKEAIKESDKKSFKRKAAAEKMLTEIEKEEAEKQAKEKAETKKVPPIVTKIVDKKGI